MRLQRATRLVVAVRSGERRWSCDISAAGGTGDWASEQGRGLCASGMRRSNDRDSLTLVSTLDV